MGCGCSTARKTPAREEPQPELPLENKLMRRVYTFYYPNGLDTTRLVHMWERSWARNGWSPVVLRPSDYTDHPMLGPLKQRIQKLPTANSRAYEDQCYLRWLAFDVKAPGVFTDFDVINYSLKPEQVVRTPEGTGPRIVALNHEGPPIPGLFVSNQAGIRAMLHDFIHGEPPIIKAYGKPHTSDMLYFFRHADKQPGDLQCANAGQAGWPTAPTVHWSNSGIIRLGGSPLDRTGFIQRTRIV